MSRSRPNVCVVKPERADSVVHIGHCLLDAYMRRRALGCKELVAFVCALEKHSTASSMPPASSYQRVMLHPDDQAYGDSLILESGAQLESCPTSIENTGRDWTICR